LERWSNGIVARTMEIGALERWAPNALFQYSSIPTLQSVNL
jgi:hypothetical protein